MNNSIQLIKQHLNILYVLSATFGPGEEEKKGTEHTLSGARGVMVDTDSGALPSSMMLVSTGTAAHRGGTHLSAWRGRRGHSG